MSDNNYSQANNQTTNPNDFIDSTPKWEGVSSDANWDDDGNDVSNGNGSSSGTNVSNNNQIDNSQGQTQGQTQGTVLNVSDITEEYPVTKQVETITPTSSNNAEQNQNKNNQFNNLQQNLPQNNNPINNPSTSYEANNQDNNQTYNTALQGDGDIAPFTLDDVNKANSDEEMPEEEVILPTKNDDASLKNQVKKATSPGGRLSLRIAGVGILTLIVVFIYLAVESSDPKANTQDKVASNKVRPAKNLKSELNSNFSSPDMGNCPEPVTTKVEKELPMPVETPPPVIINTPPEPNPIILPPPEPVIIEKEVEQPRQFAFRMRAGDETLKRYDQEKTKSNTPITTNVAINKIKVPRGTVIPLMMLQPFRSDIPTTVKCQIVSDVKNSKGEILVSSGNVAFVPFSPFRNDKRVFNQADRPATITLEDGQEIQLIGTAVDRSGGIGVQGKLIKRGDASIPKRIGRTMARVLTFGAASSVGGVGGGVIAEAGNSAVDGSYYYTAPTDSYVDVPLGTVFFFNVASNPSNSNNSSNLNN